MIDYLPVYISITFALTTFATLFLFVWTIRRSSSTHTQQKSTILFIALLLWLIVQAVLSWSDVYKPDIYSFPPKIFLFGILPALIVILSLFSTAAGRVFIDSLPLLNLTYLHIVRIPVEIVLYWLFLEHSIPELMTFEGRNFDILAGLTAPFIAYFGFIKQKLSHRMVLSWNIVCLGLLLNIVVNAFFSTPSPMQQFAFDQPNIAILYFPFSWLPTFVVPIVLLSHLVSIRRQLSSEHAHI